MLLQSVFGKPLIERLRPQLVRDSYDEEVESWEEPARKRILHADLQSVSTAEEDGSTGRLLTDRRRLAIRGAYDLTAADRVALDGVQWLVDGDPVVVRPRLGVPMTVAELRRMS